MLHGLRMFFVYGDWIGARLLPEWGALTAAVTLIVLLQAILGGLVLVFTVIGSRVNLNFPLIRDCPYFVESLQVVARTQE